MKPTNDSSLNSNQRSIAPIESSHSSARLTHSTVPDQARLSVSLPRNLYKRFKLRALEKDSTLSSLIIEMIKEEISDPAHRQSRP
ncbi:MAG: hypothetical protein ACK5IA_06585 [Cyanobacteriota bacterium]